MKKQLFTLFLMIASFLANAQFGVLDNTYADAGIQKIDISRSMSINTIPIRLANGKYICSGAFVMGGQNFKMLSLHNTDGTLDMTFGYNGYAFDITDTLINTPNVYAELQSDQKILIGSTSKGGYTVVHRYLPNGTIDASYGINGYIKFKISSYTYFTNMQIQNDDKVVVSSSATDTAVLFRLNTNGTLDNTFGVNGVNLVGYTFAWKFYKNDYLLKLQSNQYMTFNQWSGGGAILLFKYKTNGTLDSTFGTNGKKKLDSIGLINTVKELPNGKIMIGRSNRIVRVNPNGVFDSTFGNNGIFDFPNNQLVNGGNIFLLNSGNFLVNEYTVFNIYKCKADGLIDSSFGINGKKQILNLPGVSRAMIWANPDSILITGQGGIVANNAASAIVGRLDTNANWDLTFNNNGYYCKPMGHEADYAWSVSALADNSVVVFGALNNPTGVGWPWGNNSSYTFFSKLKPNGAIDSLFGTNGINRDTSNFGGGTYMLPMQDGGFLTVGDVNGIQLAKYKSNGNVDSSFATNGYSTIGGINYNHTYSPCIDTDANHYIYRPVNGYSHISYFTSFKYNSDGTANAAWGVNGFSSMKTDSVKKYRVYCQDIKAQSDNKIVMSAIVDSAGGLNKSRMGFARFNTDGSPDSTFGTKGYVIIPAIQNDSNVMWRMKLQADGKMVAAGYIQSTNNRDILVVRINTDGTLDNTFATNGYLIRDIVGSNDEANDLVILGDGRIIIVGDAKYANGDMDEFVMAINTDGTYDVSFGTNGLYLYTVGSTGAEYSRQLALSKTQEALFVAGYYQADFMNYDVFVAKVMLGWAVGVVDFAEKLPNALFLCPNPVLSQATFDYELNQDENISIQITDINGRVLQSVVNHSLQSAGKHSVSIQPAGHIIPGNYFLVFSNGKGQQVVKFTKL